MIPATPFAGLCDAIEARRSELVDIRRDLHQHPELSHQEKRTTAVLADRLGQAAIPVRRLPGTGLIADLGPADARFRVALRADFDALPVRKRTGLDFASISPDVCHACGHDVHTTALLGAALALGDLRDYLDATGTAVRFFFQAAEESIPGGADDIIAEGGMLGVDAAYALHCDPGLDVGQTEDLTFALAKVVTDLPTVLARRVDPRASALIVWGQVHAGRAGNVIPSTGFAEGTLRVLDSDVWRGLAPLLERIVDEVTAPFGVQAELTHVQGVPPVVNTAAAIGDLRSAVATVGLQAVPTAQSMGGEDFAWYLHHVSGAMARLGTRTAGGRTYDLHQGDYIVDERAIEAGAKLLGAVGLTALERFLAAPDVPTS